ncbi:MAG: hypothetical protein ACTSU5_01220 [Promethearchaeota archaeon]
MVRTDGWHVTPLRNEVVVNLIRAKGEMLDVDLLRNLRKQFPELSKKDLDHELMTLEVRGAIYVQRITKTKNKVTLRKDNQVLDSGINIQIQ